ARCASPRSAAIARPRPTVPPHRPLLHRACPQRAQRAVLPEDAGHVLFVRSASGCAPGSGPCPGPLRSPLPCRSGGGGSAVRGSAARGAAARPRAGGSCSGRRRAVALAAVADPHRGGGVVGRAHVSTTFTFINRILSFSSSYTG